MSYISQEQKDLLRSRQNNVEPSVYWQEIKDIFYGLIKDMELPEKEYRIGKTIQGKILQDVFERAGFPRLEKDKFQSSPQFRVAYEIVIAAKKELELERLYQPKIEHCEFCGRELSLMQEKVLMCDDCLEEYRRRCRAVKEQMRIEKNQR